MDPKFVLNRVAACHVHLVAGGEPQAVKTVPLRHDFVCILYLKTEMADLVSADFFSQVKGKVEPWVFQQELGVIRFDFYGLYTEEFRVEINRCLKIGDVDTDMRVHDSSSYIQFFRFIKSKKIDELGKQTPSNKRLDERYSKAVPTGAH
jgi:hypothetical protein